MPHLRCFKCHDLTVSATLNARGGRFSNLRNLRNLWITLSPSAFGLRSCPVLARAADDSLVDAIREVADGEPVFFAGCVPCT